MAALESRDGVVAVVDELEKLCLSLQEASALDMENVRESTEKTVLKSLKPASAWEKEKKDAVKKAVSKAKAETRASMRNDVMLASADAVRKGVNDIIDLLYFGNVFDPFIPYQLEKVAALNNATLNKVSVNGETLDVIGLLGKMVSAKPFGSAMSHQEAMQQCKDIAIQYVSRENEELASTHHTGKQIRDTLRKIKEMEYYTMPPPPPTTAIPPHMPPGAPADSSQLMESEYYPAVEQPVQPAAYQTPEMAAVTGQNLVHQFFGARPQDVTLPPMVPPVPFVPPPPMAQDVPANGNKTSPESFKGDEGLGIQEMGGESVENQKMTSEIPSEEVEAKHQRDKRQPNKKPASQGKGGGYWRRGQPKWRRGSDHGDKKQADGYNINNSNQDKDKMYKKHNARRDEHNKGQQNGYRNVRTEK